jgi:phosphocarrier protein
VEKLSGTFVIVNERGLHARAASTFVNLASQFESQIVVEKDGRQVDGKSILGIVSLVGLRGSEILVTAEGDDAAAALEALGQLVAHGFDEGVPR